MEICPRCGVEVSANQERCPKCGLAKKIFLAFRGKIQPDMKTEIEPEEMNQEDYYPKDPIIPNPPTKDDPQKPTEIYGSFLVHMPYVFIVMWLIGVSTSTLPIASFGSIWILLIISTAIIIALDADNLNLGKDNTITPKGMSPVGWLWCTILLWIFTFPYYLYFRKKHGMKNRLFAGLCIVFCFFAINVVSVLPELGNQKMAADQANQIATGDKTQEILQPTAPPAETKSLQVQSAITVEPEPTATSVKPVTEFISGPFEEFNKYFGPSSDLTDIQKKELFKSFEGKMVEWTGTITSVDEGPLGGLYLRIKHLPDTISSDVSVLFEKEHRNVLLGLQKEHSVTYRGILSSYGGAFTNTILKEGQVIATQ